MEGFVFVLVVVLVTPIVLLLGATFAAASTMHRANRLVPGRGRSATPLRWLWSPGAAALLHRRLRNACRLVAPLATPALPSRRRWRGRKATPTDGLADLARDVLEEALVLDDQVVSANHLAHGYGRAQALAALEYQVRGVEEAARRVHVLATRRAQLARVGGMPALNLDQRISAMEQAIGELAPPTGNWPAPM